MYLDFFLMSSGPGSPNGNLRPDRILAIKRQREIARELVANRPEIADARRRGLTANQIIDTFGLHELADERDTIKKAVNFALAELIPDPEERAELTRRNPGITLEDRVRYGRELHRDKKGVHGSTSDELKEYSKAGLMERGVVPWHENAVEITTQLDEYDYCWKLLADPNFKKKHMGILAVDLQKIADELNDIFHGGEPVRTRGSIAAVVQDKKKRG